MSQRDNRDLPPFVYEPLLPSQIRLLMPTDDEDGLSWTLQVVTLGDEVDFEALSYTWGAQDETFPITLNGRRHHVHRNLFTVLPNIARRNTYRPRWISVKKEEKKSNGPNDHNQDMNGIVSYAGEGNSAGRDDQNEASPDDLVSDSSVGTGDTEHNWMWEKASGHETMTATSLRPIWIDALCINQDNQEEKLVQLASMNRIYREAAMVWICLEPPEDSDSVDQAIEVLPTIVYATRFISECSDSQNEGDMRKNPHVSTVGRIDSKTLEVLKHLLGNPWFHRVWVIQEYSLAKRASFLYGKHVISQKLIQSMESLHLLHPFLDGKGDDEFRQGWGLFLVAIQAMGMLKVRLMVQETLHPTPVSDREGIQQLASALLMVSKFTNVFQDCLLPQDRVFGILGLLTPRQYEALGEDLFAIKDIPSLYTCFTATLLYLALCGNDGREVWQWLLAATTRKDVPGLPSWVPDLHHGFLFKRNNIDLETPEWHSYFSYNSSRRVCSAARGQSHGEITIKGTIVYNIDAVHTEHPSMRIRGGDERIAALFEWEKQAYEFCTKRSDIQRWIRAVLKLPSKRDDYYWQTLLGPRYDKQKEAETRQTYRDFHIALGKFGHNWKKTDRSSAYNAQLQGIDLPAYNWVVKAWEQIIDPSSTTGRFTAYLELNLHKQRLFRTTCGRIGFSNEKVAAGDKVCVFNGLFTPHVLRRVPGQSTEAYTLIGFAYVHGLMDGEVEGMGLEERDILLV